MTTIKAFIERHPLLSYFAVTFAISWGGFLIVVGGPGGIPGTKEQLETLLPIALLTMFAGPPVAGILLTRLLYGRAGFRDLLREMTRWRVGARWYALALLTAPLLFMAVSFALSLTSPEFLPGIFTSDGTAPVVLLGIVAGLMVGMFEELGWTGFAIPKMRLRYAVLRTGLIVKRRVGSVAHPWERPVGKRHYFRRALAGHLPARLPLHDSCRATAGL